MVKNIKTKAQSSTDLVPLPLEVYHSCASLSFANHHNSLFKTCILELKLSRWQDRYTLFKVETHKLDRYTWYQISAPVSKVGLFLSPYFSCLFCFHSRSDRAATVSTELPWFMYRLYACVCWKHSRALRYVPQSTVNASGWNCTPPRNCVICLKQDKNILPRWKLVLTAIQLCVAAIFAGHLNKYANYNAVNMVLSLILVVLQLSFLAQRWSAASRLQTPCR